MYLPLFNVRIKQADLIYKNKFNPVSVLTVVSKLPLLFVGGLTFNALRAFNGSIASLFNALRVFNGSIASLFNALRAVQCFAFASQ